MARAHALRYEWIGYDRRGGYQWVPRRSRPCKAPWVAEIVGTDAHYGLAREFLRGRLDFTKATASGRRGVFMLFLVEEARPYEVSYPVSIWEREHKLLMHDGVAMQEISREEALAWANCI